MASEQTPSRNVELRNVIAEAAAEKGAVHQGAMANHIMDALDAAGFAIVRKVPPGDKARSPELEAAMAAYYEVFTRHRHDHEEAMAAALAAVAAADGRTPDEPETIERIAQTLYRQRFPDSDEMPGDGGGMRGEPTWHDQARAVVAALKGGGDE